MQKNSYKKNRPTYYLLLDEFPSLIFCSFNVLELEFSVKCFTTYCTVYFVFNFSLAFHMPGLLKILKNSIMK